MLGIRSSTNERYHHAGDAHAVPLPALAVLAAALGYVAFLRDHRNLHLPEVSKD